MLNFTLGTLLMFTSIIMILLVLLQRGRGGGLAGAFGGMGGQSALGVRAGDVFTKITIVVAIVWVLLAGLLGISMRSEAADARNNPTSEMGLADGAEDEVDETATEDAPLTAPIAGAKGEADADKAPEVDATVGADKDAKPDSEADGDAEKPADDKQAEPKPAEADTSEEKADVKPTEKTEEAAPEKSEPKE